MRNEKRKSEECLLSLRVFIKRVKYISFVSIVAATAMLMAACDTDTASIGVVPDTDVIVSSTHEFPFTTRTLALDSVVANSSFCYLGQVDDPETGSTVKAEFVAQFHTFEDYTLPEVSSLVKNADGEVEADSVELRLYFSSYYGEGSNPMRVGVYELDASHGLSESETYYSDTDLSHYVPEGAQPLAQKIFTPSDYSLSESERTSTTHYDNVRIRIPKPFGTNILRSAIEHPEFFKDSWQFTHNVLPGFYFKLQGGTGTMLKLNVSALNIYFSYVQNDSTYVGIARFSATPEVIQSTFFQNSNLSSLLRDDVPYTYLKSPAALATEVALPVDEVYVGHEQDSVARARIILTCYNNFSDNTFGTPSTLLMVKKNERKSFFNNHRLADDITSFTTTFESAYNTYTFSNISRLMAHLFHEKQEGMKAEGLTSEQWNVKYPDWNRVVLIPVTVTTVTNQSTGVATQVGISHDFSLTSTRLVGGTRPQTMQVVYSSYR